MVKIQTMRSMHFGRTPFLLLHLGGPDTITAYSLEDNELWKRHLITLIGQVGVAFYIVLSTPIHSALSFVSLPIFVAGILKYGERTWVLRSASPKDSRKSLRQRKNEVVAFTRPVQERSNDYQQAYLLFRKAKHLFADVLLLLDDVTIGKKILLEKSATEAFKVVEIELGYMYDSIYTKASISYSKPGMAIRFISLLCSISSVFAYWLSIDKHVYSKIDIIITYLLLVGAIFLEIYALLLVIFSDWTLPLVTSSTATLPLVTSCRALSSSLLKLPFTKGKKWSESMAQYNLIKFCLGKQTAWNFPKRRKVTINLKEFIHEKINEKARACVNADGNFNEQAQMKQLVERGEQVLETMDCLDDLREYTIDVDFDHSILLWHIATCICDRMEMEGNHDSDYDKSKHEFGRSLSEYMLYLLVECPQMLPKGIGESFYLDTCEQAKTVFKQKPQLAGAFKSKRDQRPDQQQLIKLIEATGTVFDTITPGNKYGSQLNLGVKLAEKLQNKHNKWNLISEMWVEMLIYAASHGGWRSHAQQLMKGGELMTHVAILMAHVGLSQQSKLGF